MEGRGRVKKGRKGGGRFYELLNGVSSGSVRGGGGRREREKGRFGGGGGGGKCGKREKVEQERRKVL